MTVSEIIQAYLGDRSYREAASELTKMGFPISHAALRDWVAGEYVPNEKTIMLMKTVPGLGMLAEDLERAIFLAE